MAAIIDGKTIAAEIRSHIKREAKALSDAKKITPGLVVVMVGDNSASAIYVRNKRRYAEETGIHFSLYHLPEDTDEASVLNLIFALNRRMDVDGILVQMPLPSHIHAPTVISAIDPLKDVDGFHPLNIGHLFLKESGLFPCTPLGIMHLVRSVVSPVTGLHAVVVGRSNLVGKPASQMLLNADCTVTTAHSKTKDLPDLCRQADILVAAVGQPGFIKGSWIKSGAIVIDVGINQKKDGTLTGDVDFQSAEKIARAITPVPGGVGPMTIAMLLSNTLKACLTRHRLLEQFPLFSGGSITNRR